MTGRANTFLRPETASVINTGAIYRHSLARTGRKDRSRFADLLARIGLAISGPPKPFRPIDFVASVGRNRSSQVEPRRLFALRPIKGSILGASPGQIQRIPLGAPQPTGRWNTPRCFKKRVRDCQATGPRRVCHRGPLIRRVLVIKRRFASCGLSPNEAG